MAAGIDFFEPGQENYLKSLVAHPISGLRTKTGEVVTAAIVLDSNQPGIFRESDRDTIAFLLDEFAARLTLESHLFAFGQLANGR